MMSVFGGDSWAREAEQRKRRIDDLLMETTTSNSNNHKKLSNGKYVCLVCPNNPLLDSLLMLSIHNRGSRHVAAEAKHRERELFRQDEIKKRIALSEDSANAVSPSLPNQHHASYKSPLTVQTRKLISEVLHDQTSEEHVTSDGKNVKRKGCNVSFFSPNHLPFSKQKTESSPCTKPTQSAPNDQTHELTVAATGKMLEEQQVILWKQRERELKFRAAGWKHDGNGKWFREENVEFDSDEEDPNVCLT